mmetsp:Transcript_17028/g.33746  ORF Transcript_17028/g.33746 Transcript_17028/m.33746 type:complete len:109 (-) Transcript_17028:60-386(-)
MRGLAKLSLTMMTLPTATFRYRCCNGASRLHWLLLAAFVLPALARSFVIQCAQKTCSCPVVLLLVSVKMKEKAVRAISFVVTLSLVILWSSTQNAKAFHWAWQKQSST